MLPFFSQVFANPGSSTHTAGREAAVAVKQSREKVAGLIGASPAELIFTGSATESNNLALLGVAQSAQSGRRTVLTMSVEHKSVLEPLGELQRRGFNVQVLPVDSHGRLDMDAYTAALSEETLLVSVQGANNEIGTIQDIARVSELARAYGALIHCDAVQAVGRIPVNVDQWDVDLLSLSAHKLYGPKGAAALYIRGGPGALPICPLMYGGGQEYSLRPGTLNVPAIVGFGEACAISAEVLDGEATRIQELRDYLEEILLSEIRELRRNGDLSARLPGNSSLTFKYVDADALIANLPELGLTTGSACTSGTVEPSYVLLAIGLRREEAHRTLRLGIGRFTTEREMDIAADLLVTAYHRIYDLVSA